MTASDNLIIPEWGNSGPGHWQTLWAEELPNAARVEQREWINVALDDWVCTRYGLTDYLRIIA
jgi:predicted alpha/beta hydrolase family esterase